MKKLAAFILVLIMVCTSAGVGVLASEAGSFTTDPMITSGDVYSVALKPDGTVWTAGGFTEYWNSYEQPPTEHCVPTRVTSLSSVIAVTAGAVHAAALKSDGTVWTWGENYHGQLGDNTIEMRNTPVQVVGLTNVTAISAGRLYTIALKADGTVWAWGNNIWGQLGDGSRRDDIPYSSIPVQVKGLSNVIEIAAGYTHAMALKSDGTVWGWGYNGDSNLGDGTSSTRDIPVPITGLSDVVSLSWGRAQFARKSDGTVWTWGFNPYIPTKEKISTPVQVPELSAFSQISVGYWHAIAMKPDGTVWTWGSNESNQLGNGVTADYALTPVQLPGASGVSSVAAGAAQSFAVMQDGTVYAWGMNDYGVIGNSILGGRFLVPARMLGENKAGCFNLLGENYKDDSALVPTKWTTSFTDVSTADRNYRSIAYVATKGIMNGTGKTTFSPEAPMSRGMMVTVLWHMTGSPSAEKEVSAFTDVAPGAYYANAVQWARAGGIVSGVSSSQFAPDIGLTKQDAIVILKGYMDWAEINIPATQEYQTFADEAQIADYAKNAMQTMNKIGVLTGMNNGDIQPRKVITRAEVAGMLHRFLEAQQD